MKHKRQIWLKGSYTVEAAFIIPIFFFIFFAVIYFSFYLADFIRIQRVIDETQEEGMALIRREGEMITGQADYEKINKKELFFFNFQQEETKIKETIEEKLKNRLWITKLELIEVSASVKRIEIMITVTMQISIPEVKSYYNKFDKSWKIERELPVHNPADHIRKLDGLEELVEKAGGV